MTGIAEQVAAAGPVASGEYRLGRLDDIPPGEGRAYFVAGTQVAVFRPRNGPPRATAAQCPHAGGPLADGQLDGCVVLCPLHGNVYELDTGSARNGSVAVTVFPVRLEEGAILLTLP